MKIFNKLLIISGMLTVFIFAENADQIMRKVYSKPKPKTMSGTAQMILREKDGTIDKRIFKMYSRKTKQGKDTLNEFITPASVKGTKFLTIGNDEKDDIQKLFLPDLGKVRTIAASGKGGSFMDSDLSYYDLEERSFEDGTYRLIGEADVKTVKDGKKKNMTCWKVESIPTEESAPYGKIVYYVSREDYFIYKFDLFDDNGQKIKIVKMNEVKTFEKNIIIAVKTLAASADGHKSLFTIDNIKINESIDPGIFTKQYLEK